MLSYYPIRISFYLSLGTQRLYLKVPTVHKTVSKVIPGVLPLVKLVRWCVHFLISYYILPRFRNSREVPKRIFEKSRKIFIISFIQVYTRSFLAYNTKRIKISPRDNFLSERDNLQTRSRLL